MKPTPFLGSAALVFWGFHSDLAGLAVLMALVLESPRLTEKRWVFTNDQLNKITDTCTVLVAGTAIFFLSDDPVTVLRRTLALLPVLTFPLVAVQGWSLSGTTDIRALFLFNRKQPRSSASQSIDLAYPFVLVCLISAGTSGDRSWIYPAGSTLLISAALFFQRPDKVRIPLWVLAVMVSAGLGLALQGSMITLQRKLGRMTYRFLMMDRTDPLRRSTAIGEIGKLKLSDRILFRVTPGPGMRIPSILLKEGSYNFFSRNSWIATHNTYHDLPPGGAGIFTVNTGSGPSDTVTVTHRLPQGRGLLKLPEHTLSFRIPGTLPDLSTNRLGPVYAEHGPGLISYDVQFSRSSDIHAPPDGMDLVLPPLEKSWFQDLADGLAPDRENLEGKELLARINTYFLKNFHYSTDLKPSKAATPLIGFMTETRQGHCEYFATATVFLLRAMGFPARYVSGYLAFEKSLFSTTLVVRAKHAHAWVEVYMNGQWTFVDTTPPSWQNDEKSNGFMTLIPDLLSNMSHWLAMLRWGSAGARKHLLWLLVPLALIILRRLRSGSNRTRPENRIQPDSQIRTSWPDLPASPLLIIQDHLIRKGFHKPAHETCGHFVERLKTRAFNTHAHAGIDEMIELHNRLCFSESGITDQDLARFSETVRTLAAMTEKSDPESTE